MKRLLLLVALAALVACTPGAPPSAPDDAPAAAPTNRLAIPSAVRQAIGITFARVEARALERTLRIPGAFELEPGARREYRLPAAGHVELLVDAYATVEEGDPLFRWRSPDWTALVEATFAAERRIALSRAAHGVRVAEAEGARARLGASRARLEALHAANVQRADLAAETAERESEVATAEAALRLADAEITAAESEHAAALTRAADLARLSVEDLLAPTGSPPRPRLATLDALLVRATSRGVIESMALADGVLAEPLAVVLTTIDPGAVQFRGTALQSDLARLADAGAARLVLPVREPPASVDATWELGLAASALERTIEIRAAPTGHAEWIRPGIAVFLEVVLETTDRPVLTVPRGAIVESGLERVLFRRDPGDPDHAIRLVADVGATTGGFVELQSGVMAGDEVVLAGAYELALASAAAGTVQRGGHMHADGTFHADH